MAIFYNYQIFGVDKDELLNQTHFTVMSSSKINGKKLVFKQLYENTL